MLKPSGSTPIGHHLGAELPERLGRDLVGGAVGAIDDDAHAVRSAWRGRVRLANSM